MGASRLIVSIKEHLFLKFILDGMMQRDAYRKINPNKEYDDNAASQGGWKYMQRIKKKIPWDKILDAWELGIERIAKVFEEQLTCTRPHFHQNMHLGNWPDNAARGQALCKLVDVHKLAIQKLEVTGKDGHPLEVLSTLNDIIKYHEEHQPDSDEVQD